MSRFDGQHDVVLVLLAGIARPTRLHAELGIHPLIMPLHVDYTLCDAWLDLAAATEEIREVCIAVNTDADLQSMSALAARREDIEVQVLRDGGPWRGSAGAAADAARSICPEGEVIAVETSRLPPRSLDAVIESLRAGADAVVGGARDGEPQGVYGLSSVAVHAVPRIGYFDLKEQLLPKLHRNGQVMRIVAFDDGVYRIRERGDYLNAIREWGRRRPGSAATCLANGVRILGPCYIGRGVRIEPGAVISESAILDGATVGRGAVVHQSVVGPGATVEEHAVAVEQVVTAGTAGAVSAPSAAIARVRAGVR